MAKEIETYSEFWAFYLRAHSRAGTRGLHYLGTVLGAGIAIVAAISASWWLLLAALAVGYGLAWVGHFVVERNVPATFGHPLWSFYSDFHMAYHALRGSLGEELERAALPL